MRRLGSPLSRSLAAPFGRRSSSAVPGVPYRLLDGFAGTNADLLTAHTMDVGAGWAATNGAWEIQGNRASAKTLTSAFALALAESNAADVTVTAIVQRGTVNYVGVALRGVDAQNYWIAAFNNATILLVKRVANSPSIVTSAAFTSTTGVDVVLQVVAAAGTITVYADGVQKLQATAQSSLQTATKCGLYSEGVANLVDSFQVA